MQKNNPERDKSIAMFCAKCPYCIVLKGEIDLHDMEGDSVVRAKRFLRKKRRHFLLMEKEKSKSETTNF